MAEFLAVERRQIDVSAELGLGSRKAWSYMVATRARGAQIVGADLCTL